MTEPNPANPISWLVKLLLGLMGVFLFAAVPVSSTAQVLPPDPAGRPVQARPPADEDRSMLPENAELFGVETVDVLIRESAPPQISVTVSGYWSNGCTAEPQIITAIDGSTVTVTIYRIIPPEVMCTMVLQAAEFEIELTDLLVKDGAVRSGAYSFNVNGVITGTQF